MFGSVPRNSILGTADTASRWLDVLIFPVAVTMGISAIRECNEKERPHVKTISALFVGTFLIFGSVNALCAVMIYIIALILSVITREHRAPQA